MREPPPHLTDEAVLAAVRDHWLPAVDDLTHLPVGFGGHHWAARVDGEPCLFLTLDPLRHRHTAETLEAAYAGAAALAAQGLHFVHAGLTTGSGRFTVPLAGDLLSATPWLAGRTGDGAFPDEPTASTTARMLDRLHAATPPPGLPHWTPLVAADLPERLAERTATAWDTGPHGEPARTAIRDHLEQIRGWTTDYLASAATTDPEAWVVTHGEPHTRNQVTTPTGQTVLVDWESLKLAPAERDLRVLVQSGWGGLCDADPRLVAMFDLEWRLDEISQYADWFEAPHAGTDSDTVAMGGLLHELER